MATYCQEAQTASVTLPDQSIQAFPGPIEVECTPITGEQCQSIYFVFNLTVGGLYGTSTANFRSSINNRNRNFFAPFYGGARLVPTNSNPDSRNRAVDVEVEGVHSCSGRGWFRAYFRNIYLEILSINSVEVFPGIPGQALNQVYRLTVSKDQIILFEQDYSSCDYSVSCTGCPPGTLDCTDCCLPCDEVFNSISSMRSQVANLR